MKFILLFLIFSLAFAAPDDTLYVTGKGRNIAIPVGIWNFNDLQLNRKKANLSVILWFHGGMHSGNCSKGIVAGEAISKLFPQKIVISASACKEKHWGTQEMIDIVDWALDSIEIKTKKKIDSLSVIGISDGFFGVMNYSYNGKRKQIMDHLIISSYGPFLGSPSNIGKLYQGNVGRWRFIQGGADVFYQASETVPWIEEFCKSVKSDCKLRFDSKGEHDWKYWQENHLDWIYESIF